METTHSGSESGAFRLDAGLEFHKVIDFDKRQLRRALVKGAAEVRKSARRMVSRAAVSNPGEFPGVDAGRLKRAIGTVKKGSKGGWIRVGVRSIPGSMFYPAVLFYGSRKRGIAKRGNYITAALDEKRDLIRNDIRSALKGALVPR